MRRQAVRLAAVAAVLAATSIAAAPASAASLGGLHDARYCEIIELEGAPPDATATVWNTIGLNRCPAAWWRAFDATELAQELGDTAVVLNGPRHFLMDSVTASPGVVRSFHGERLRRVAAIPIRTAAELVQTPYTDRTIVRDNTWHWRRGRLVYELVAPGGDVYVMQSYSQIRDPSMSIRKLRSLGRRLDPPPGWRYRTRRLRHDLSVAAIGGHATIVQDELQNTYQLARTTRRPGPRKRRAVSIHGATKMVTATTPGTIEDHGTLTGTPFGRGSVAIVVVLKDGRATGTFRMLFAKGSITGTVSMPFTIEGGEIDFRGTARFTGGTGAYRGISSGALQAHDHNTLDGQNGVVTVKGSATY
ncbi:MAG: hypothetical protein QOD71_2341 [Thermoleophilaceae bacterium]|jgi:hypothetical protein|nr:hypothetical protein [Thermoleophilaceae bacterium]